MYAYVRSKILNNIANYEHLAEYPIFMLREILDSQLQICNRCADLLNVGSRRELYSP